MPIPWPVEAWGGWGEPGGQSELEQLFPFQVSEASNLERERLLDPAPDTPARQVQSGRLGTGTSELQTTSCNEATISS